jgi:hypothetical protein
MTLKNLMSYGSSENERLDVISKQYQKKVSRRDILLVIGIHYKVCHSNFVFITG